MTKEQSSREVEYKMSLKLLNILLNRGIITEDEYVKIDVLDYHNKILPKNFVLRLKGLASGKCMANKNIKANASTSLFSGNNDSTGDNAIYLAGGTLNLNKSTDGGTVAVISIPQNLKSLNSAFSKSQKKESSNA